MLRSNTCDKLSLTVCTHIFVMFLFFDLCIYVGYIHLIIVFIFGPALVSFKPSSLCCTFSFVLLLLYLYFLVLELLLGVVHFCS